MSKILVVEDDFYLRRNLKEILLKNGYEVIDSGSVGEALCYVRADDTIDIYILDLWLPDGEGFDICKAIRRKNSKPVIFLTVCDDEESVVKGLNLGGDDYIIKPYRTKELLSRIEANLRRARNWQSDDILRSEALCLDKAQSIVYKEGQMIHLSPVEYALLLVLMENAECIVKREKLLAGLWDDAGNLVEDNTLSVTLSRLRSKIGSAYIETVRGFGYRFARKVYRGRYAEDESK